MESASGTGRRSEEKRQAILDAALRVFTANGYLGTTTDQLAAAASVSKQTLYKYFHDKEGLFTALITTVSDRIHDPFQELTAAMGTAPDSEAAVRILAEQFAHSIMSAQVQQIRRLVIAEAARFPDLGRLYWQRGFERVLASVAACLRVLAERELLAIADPAVAAQHLAGILLWIPSNRVMFCGIPDQFEAETELKEVIELGVKAFISAYRFEITEIQNAQQG